MVNYIRNLDRYITDEDTAEDCKTLARKHLTKVVTRTCSQHKFAYQDLKYLSSHESIQQHLEVLDKSVTQFTNQYRDRFTEKDVKEIREGLKVLEQKVEIRNNYSPSFGFR